ncbi:hypothetical protein TRFO_43149 [Tritrichomonas foetus]|nr:hypothetical protein TRFO_43149 [Tritrichomonas foetus]|eukprot:OHT14184.1 hypothetical protein TRFO_43149 [Tritrichomonas foetus]
MFQRSKKLIESGLPGSCFALPFQDKIKDQFLLDHCSCPEKQYLTKLHDEPNFPCEHTVYMFVTKKIRLLTEKIEFEYSVDPMIQVEMKKSINQWKLIKNRRLPKTYDRYLSAGLGLIEKLNYHTTSDFIYYYKNLTRQIINEMSPEIVNPADIPILISLFVVNSIKPGYDIMKYENVITRDITKFISYEAFHGENFLEEVMNRIKALKEIKDQRETEEIKACKQYLRENTNQNQINIPRNKFVLPILNCSKPKYVMPIFNRI